MIDLIVVCIIFILALIGYKVGFVRMIVGFSSSVISMFLAWIFYPVVSKIVLRSSIYRKVESSVKKSVSSIDISNIVNSISDSAGRGGLSLPRIKSYSLGNLKLPAWVVNYLKPLLKNAGENVYNSLVTQLATMFVNIISMMLVFIVCRLLIHIGVRVLDLVTMIPVIHQVNCLGGGVFGILQGMFIVYVAFGFFAIFPMIGKSSTIQTQIDSSYVAKVMYYDNILFKVFLPKYMPK
jgi:uncharacterized membrane protein required for colicin V production